MRGCVVGNRLTENTHLGNSTYVYDIANRLSSVNGVTYTWDNNGNLLNDGVYTYSYDRANRLKTASGQGSNYSFGYNGNGDRLQQTVNSATTNYTLDLNAGLTQVLSDGSITYLYGNARILQDRGTSKEYFLTDALGSVRQLADASGAVILGKSYQSNGKGYYDCHQSIHLHGCDTVFHNHRMYDGFEVHLFANYNYACYCLSRG